MAGNFKDIQVPKQRAFLNAYAECGQIDRAALAAQIHYSSHYKWLKSDPEYRPAFEEAKEIAADLLESEATRRAKDGLVRKKFTSKGLPVIDPATGEQYAEHEYSDTLMTVLLKGVKPERYRDNSTVEHKGAITVEYVNNWRSSTD